MSDTDLPPLVRRWFDQVWGEGDLDLIDELVTDPYVRHNLSGTATVSRAQLKKDMVQYQRVLHRPVTTIEDQAVVGSTVWTRATSRGVNLERDRPTTITWLIVQRFEGGRIAESWSATITDVDWRR